MFNADAPVHSAVHVDSIRSLLHATSLDGVRRVQAEVCAKLGFTFHTSVALTRNGGQVRVRRILSLPDGWEQSHVDAQSGHRDPVLAHLKHSHLPIAWDRETYLHADCADLFDAQAPYGFHSGIASAMHMPNGSQCMVGFDRDKSLPSDAELGALLGTLQLYLVHLQEALTLLDPDPRPIELPVLTASEVEAMRWTMAGKTAWEVSVIMSMSERAATRCIASAVRKLNCVNKQQAVARAIVLGLIA